MVLNDTRLLGNSTEGIVTLNFRVKYYTGNQRRLLSTENGIDKGYSGALPEYLEASISLKFYTSSHGSDILDYIPELVSSINTLYAVIGVSIILLLIYLCFRIIKMRQNGEEIEDQDIVTELREQLNGGPIELQENLLKNEDNFVEAIPEVAKFEPLSDSDDPNQQEITPVEPVLSDINIIPPISEDKIELSEQKEEPKKVDETSEEEEERRKKKKKTKRKSYYDDETNEKKKKRRRRRKKKKETDEEQESSED